MQLTPLLLRWIALGSLLANFAFAQVTPVGGIARNFTVTNRATGQPLQLTDLAGKIIVLDFFAYWCGPCQESSPAIEANIQSYYRDRGGNPAKIPVQVLAVNIEPANPTATNTFITNAGLELVGDDFSGDTYAQFAVTSGIPRFAIINGVAASPTHKQWEVVYNSAGYPGAPAMRALIDAIAAGATASPLTPGPTVFYHPAKATLTVNASGTGLAYQWFQGLSGTTTSPIAGATSSTYTPPPGTAAWERFWVRVTNTNGTFNSPTYSILRPATTPALGALHTVFVKADLTAWAMGNNSWGKLGTGNYTNAILPVQIMTGVTAVAANDYHSLFVKSDGTAWATGANSSGVLGDGTTTLRTSPVQVLTGTATVACGSSHSLFLKRDGTVWATGSNSNGQLGDGSTPNRTTPAQVLTAVVAIAGGDQHSLFLKSDGTVWATGANWSGQLGDDTYTTRLTPVKIMSDIVAISAGTQHSLFLKSDGTVWGTGNNANGQLGIPQSRTSKPVQIMAGVAALSAGGHHSVFLKTNGSVWATGENNYGQLGDGTYTRRYTPAQVMTGVAAIAAGQSTTFYYKTNSTFYASGDNEFGQLGDGTQVIRPTPVLVVNDITLPTSLQGRFEGILVAGTTPELPLAKLAITVSANGAFTGTLTHPVPGTLPLAGKLVPATDATSANLAVLSIGTGSSTYVIRNLRVSTSTTAPLTATLRKGTSTSTFATLTDGVKLRTFSTTSPAPWNGAYTATFAPGPNLDPATIDRVAPTGAGYATGSVAPNGTLTLTGKLADGTPFTGAYSADTTGAYRLFTQPHGTAGNYFGGWIKLTRWATLPSNRYRVAPAGQELYWHKPAKTTDASYPAGFGPLTVNASLATYLPPTSTLNLITQLGVTSTEAATLPLKATGGGLTSTQATTLSSTAKLSTTNALTVNTSAKAALWPGLLLNPATGLLTGSIKVQDTATTFRTAPWSGVVVQLPPAERAKILAQGFFTLPPKPGATTPPLGGHVLLTAP